MPNKMIPFPYKIKITHFDFCYYVTILLKINTVEAFFIFFFYFYENKFWTNKLSNVYYCDVFKLYCDAF